MKVFHSTICIDSRFLSDVILSPSSSFSPMSFPMNRLLAVFAVSVALLRVPLLAQDSPAGFQLVATFDYPGSSLTIPHGINQRGDVAGEFSDVTGVHGFVRYQYGTFSAPITDPNDPGGESFAFDLNRAAVVGLCVDLTDFSTHSFALVHGGFIDIDVPGSVSTTALGLNLAGDYCGSFDDGSGVMQAFVKIGRTLEEFQVAGAIFTSANAINDLRSTAGVYQLGDGNTYGFVRDSAGNVTFIDYPGTTATILRGINNSGIVVGGEVDSHLVQHGFVFRPPDKFLSYTYPDSTFTTFEGVNDRNQICGQYKDADGQRHGFILRAF
jgi:hypothetical protein